MEGIRLLIDTSKCVACKACQVSCQQWHSLQSEDTTFTGTYQNPPDMSGTNLTVVKFREIVDTKLKWIFFKDQCRHCDNPTCMKHCPLKAIIREANGIVKIDPAICDPSKCSWSATKPCQSRCPYGIPKYKYVKNGSLVRTDMRKCDFCYDRFIHGQLPEESKKPSCQVTCPPGAISSGDADSILSDAESRVSYLKSIGFPDANIYPDQNGKCCWGPTHVIWVLTEDPSKYGVGMGMGMMGM